MTRALRNKLASQVGLAFSQAVFPFITYPVITKALGPQGLGKVVYVDSWVQMLGLIAALGIPLYGIREIAKFKDKPAAQAKTFLELFLLQCLTAVPFLFILFLAGRGFQFDPLLLRLGMAAFVANAVSSEWFFQGREAFFFIALRTMLIRLAALLLIVFYIREAGDIFLYYGILTASALLTALLNLFYAFRRVDFNLKQVQLFHHLKKLNWVYGCYLLFSFYAISDSVILGLLSTEAAVGAYNLGYRLIRMSTMLIISLGAVFIPKISYLYASGQQTDLWKEMSTAQHLLFFFSLPFSLFFLAMAPEIVNVLATEAFSSSITVMRIGSLIPLLLSLSHFAGIQVMIPLHREKLLFGVLLTFCLLNLALNILLVPSLHETGTAIATLTTELGIAMGCLFFLQKMNLLRFQYKAFFSTLLPALVIFPVAYFFRSFQMPALPVLLYTFTLSAFFYLGTHLLLIKDSILQKFIGPSK